MNVKISVIVVCVEAIIIGYYIVCMTVPLLSSCQWARSGAFFAVVNFEQITQLVLKFSLFDFVQVNTHWVYSDFCICVHLFCWHFYTNKNIEFLLGSLTSFMLKQTCNLNKSASLFKKLQCIFPIKITKVNWI